MTAILSDFAQTLLALALPILAAYLAATLKAFLEQSVASMRARASADSRYLIDDAVTAAVRAAEQLGGASDAKLTYAIDQAGAYLRHHGIGLDLPVLRGLVEAAVKAEFGKPSGGQQTPKYTLTDADRAAIAELYRITAGQVMPTTGREIE